MVKPRNTINSVNIANGPKLDNNKYVEEKLDILQTKVNILEYNLAALSTELMEEKTARCNLQTIVKKYLLSNSKDLDNLDWSALETSI